MLAKQGRQIIKKDYNFVRPIGIIHMSVFSWELFPFDWNLFPPKYE